MRKNTYEVILQQNNGYGWDDVEYWETNSTFRLTKEEREDLKYLKSEYRRAQPASSLRVIRRRTPKTK